MADKKKEKKLPFWLKFKKGKDKKGKLAKKAEKKKGFGK